MSVEDRKHWDTRYAEGGPAPLDEVLPYPHFRPFVDLFPTDGTCLEIACGRGRGAAWLATRGMQVHGVDVSPVAIELATSYAAELGLSALCRFEVHDLDDGLPEGPPVDLLLCYLFRQPDLDRAMVERVSPGGMLAVAVLSEVDAGPGRFRAKPGELSVAFGSQVDVIESGEADGHAWLIGRR